MKKVLMVLIILLLFAAVGAGIFWHMAHYIMIDFRFYPKNERSLDLRGQEVSVKHYEKIRRRLPDCEVQWDVPFQGGAWSEDTQEITVTTLSETDIAVLDYLTELKTVQAEGCTDYTNLLLLQEHRPELEVSYSVTLGEQTFPQDAEEVELMEIGVEEISLLRCFPELKKVVCCGGETEAVSQLQEYCRDNGLKFCVGIGGKAVADTTREITLTGVTEKELPLLQFLPKLEEVKLKKPEAAAEALVRLRAGCPGVEIIWEQEICGVLCSTEDEEIDLSKAKIRNLDQVEQGMAYFPDAETVFLGKCGISNEKLADFREQVREEYKVAWTVQCGDELTARTDDTTFMPVREHVYYFNDEEAYNLRYCEDMVCIDIGHMSISDISFVEYMPDLEFLILAHTQVQYIEPISSCKKLKFLELDWAPIKDYTPLVECTALEDLNVGNTFADFEPIGKMTWLKNLWMIGCSRGPAYRMTQALTETKVMVSGPATVANGWRNLDNYYEMRDLLGMEYMSW